MPSVTFIKKGDQELLDTIALVVEAAETFPGTGIKEFGSTQDFFRTAAQLLLVKYQELLREAKKRE